MKRKIYIIFILILFISIGFAVLTSNLGINGTASFTDASFDVYLYDIYEGDYNVEESTINIEQTSTTTATIAATFEQPGDYIDVSLTIINSGTMDAQLNTLTVSGLSDELKNYFDYSIKYLFSDNKNVTRGDVLRAGQGKKMTFHIEYKYDVESLSSASNLNLTLTMNYINPKKAVSDTTWEYEYLGREQIFYVNKSGNYQIEAWGSGGRPYKYTDANGKGAYTKGTINLNKNEKYYIIIGNHVGTFNGIGNKANEGTIGGGATDIRLLPYNNNSFDSLKSRIMVAGAGGGVEYHSDISRGGSGGGLKGYNATYSNGGVLYDIPNSGGTQTTGGIAIYSQAYNTYGNAGQFGKGGNANNFGGGGGAGYFGGSGGVNRPLTSYNESAGGGGSSYISGHIGCVALDGSSTSSNIVFPTKHNVICNDGTTDIDCSIHNSGKYFTNTVMIDGEGHEWKYHNGDTEVTVSNDVVGMPMYIGNGTMTGNNNPGFVRITYLGNN